MPDTPLTGRHYLVLDGWQYRREPLHWQGWLAERLVQRGATVDYLTLPDPENPRYDAWSATVRTALAGRANVTVVAHGLSVLLWLRMCGENAAAQRAVLVAPPAPGLHGGDISAPLPDTVTPDALAASTAEPTLLVFSPDDPYLPEGAEARYGIPLALASVEIAAGAHLNAASGYGPWPAMLTWCETGVWPASAFAAEVERLFAPEGRRLGIVVAGDLDDAGLAVVDATLRSHALEPDRRRARLQPRVGEPALRAADAAEFGALYGHEYSVAVLDAALAPDPATRAHLVSTYRTAGCAVVWA